MSATFTSFRTMPRLSLLGGIMRAFRLLLIVALVGVVTAPVASSSISAGANAAGIASYLSEQGPVQRSGFWGSAPTITDNQVLSVGYTVCDFHRQGKSEIEILTAMLAGNRPPASSEVYRVGMDGVRDALRYLC